MTLLELLHSVDFDKVAKAYRIMYPIQPCDISLLKCHFDMLCNYPITDSTDNSSQECHISYAYDNITRRSYLTAFSLECDHWRNLLGITIKCKHWKNSLNKTISLDPNLIVTTEEIAACCLWHTSFYGYTEEQVHEMGKRLFNNMTDYEISKQKLSENLSVIESITGSVVELPTPKEVCQMIKYRIRENYNLWIYKHFKKRQRNRIFRKELFPVEYINQMNAVAQFMIDVGEVDSSWFLFKKFVVYSYRSFSYGKSNPADYLNELVTKYCAFNLTFRNVYICIFRNQDNSQPDIDIISTLSDSERDLCVSIISQCNDVGVFNIKTKYDPELRNEMKIVVAFYE